MIRIRLMGFGHRVYKNFDPRATVMREICNEVLDELGVEDDPLFRIAEARRDRTRRRLLQEPQPVSERRLLLRDHS